MQIRAIALAAFFAASFSAHADQIALWDFNALTCTASGLTKCTDKDLPKPTSANGGVLAMLGGVSFSSAGGVAGNALNTTGYAAQSTGSLTSGVQFMVDTSGYNNVVLTFAQRDSNSASAYTTLLYTTNGTDWLNGTSYFMPTAKATTFVTGITYDFSAITAVNNNENFGVRLVTSFAPNTTSYIGAGLDANKVLTYGTSGTIRYDNVTFSGTAIPDPLPVPEPQTYALMLAGLATVAWVARRRRAR